MQDLDAPVAAYPSGELGGSGLAGGQAGDRVDGGGLPFAAVQRIARARRRRGLSQAALAGLVGRSKSWLSQVERGLRQIDSHSILTSLAEVLRVDAAELTGDGSAEQQASQYTAAKEIERAMMANDGLESVIGGGEAGRRAARKRADISCWPGRCRGGVHKQIGVRRHG